MLTEVKNYLTKDEDLVVCNQLYIVESSQICFSCKKETRVICFATDDFWLFPSERRDFSFASLNKYHIKNRFKMFSLSENLPPVLEEYLKSHFNVDHKYSKQANAIYFANCCGHCNVLQGNYHISPCEPDTPFLICGTEELNKLRFYSVRLNQNLSIIRGEHFYMFYNDWEEEDLYSLIKENVTLNNTGLIV